MKIVTKGYRILFHLYLVFIGELQEQTLVKLIDLSSISNEHMKMFRYYIIKNSYFDYSGRCIFFWGDKYSEALSQLCKYPELEHKYDQILEEQTKSERSRRERRKIFNEKMKKIFR